MIEVCLGVLLAALIHGIQDKGESSVPVMLSQPQDLIEGVPSDFSRFSFAGHDQQAQSLNRYLWYHFHNRGGNGKTLFNKEYLTFADLWIAGATDRHRHKSIQEVHREDLLGIELDAEGYVNTHQHFSHAHDWGWPFPLWTQSDGNPAKVIGQTAGWHFQNDHTPGWVNWSRAWNRPEFFGDGAVSTFTLENVKSHGVQEEIWKLEATAASPAILTSTSMPIDAFQAPFLQLRWKRFPVLQQRTLPYLEWLREGDTQFSSERRVYFDPPDGDELKHSILTMYRHPLWQGQIKQMRIVLAPGESDVRFEIDSFFTVYDTRHTINNPIFVMACWEYFRWTGDLAFLKASINRMRLAYRYMQTELGGLEHNHIRNTWPGHDSRAGWLLQPDGSKVMRSGHGIGNNYWDLLPFGWDDFYSTSQYYAATLVMAEAEQRIADNPGWDMPLGALRLNPTELQTHAAKVREVANQKFWNEKTGRFYASIDPEGKAYDYGLTFLNLDAIWYGIASEEHARSIMDWIDGRRIVEGDTSTGEDIYRWGFGPRATTLRNIEWYGQGWTAPEAIPWGGQIQDGGAVLGFAFYDLIARLRVYGADDAWKRFKALLDWDDKVISEGGYRAYYADGRHGTTLQGGGTAGGIGVDCEFFESSLVPAFAVYGLLGLAPDGETLSVSPQLPTEVPEMAIFNLLFRNLKMDLQVSAGRVIVVLKDSPIDPLPIQLKGEWECAETGETGCTFLLKKTGTWTFNRK